MDLFQIPNKTNLGTAKTYQEAVNILKSRKAPTIYKKYVDMAFSIKDESGNIRNKMLSEAEDDLQKDEEKKAMSEMEHKDDAGEMGHQMTSEAVHEREDDQGDSRKTGESPQSDGETLDAVKPPGGGTADAPESAQAAKGTSQLKEMLQPSPDQGSVDPMNQCVIQAMGNGMSEVEAQNHCAKQNAMVEAIVDQRIRKMISPILGAADKNNAALREAIKMTDGKKEQKRTLELKHGLSEGKNMAGSIAAAPQKQTSKWNGLEEKGGIETLRKDLAGKYLTD